MVRLLITFWTTTGRKVAIEAQMQPMEGEYDIALFRRALQECLESEPQSKDWLLTHVERLSGPNNEISRGSPGNHLGGSSGGYRQDGGTAA